MIGDEGEQLLKEYVKSMSGIKDDDENEPRLDTHVDLSFSPGSIGLPVQAAKLDKLLFPPYREDYSDITQSKLQNELAKRLAGEIKLAEEEATIRRLDKSAAELLERADKVIKNQQTQIDFLKSMAADLFECLMENGYERI